MPPSPSPPAPSPPETPDPLSVAVVIPTIGRPSLQALLNSLARAGEPVPDEVVVVDDRRERGGPLLCGPVPAPLRGRVRVVRSGPTGGRGPAAARNAGWRAAGSRWVAFLDDDVLLPAGWPAALQRDLAPLGPEVGASQGRVQVPLPASRAPTDWERNVAGLATARWATADMAYRRAVLAAVGGFDERFTRAYREDADLGLRTQAAGYRIVVGRRRVIHPVRPADDWVSVRLQAGNAEDPFMRALHGRDWRRRAGVSAGRRSWHLTTSAAAAIGLLAGLRDRRAVALLAGAAWSALTADFAWRRIAPGPRTATEIRRMALTSLVLPQAASWHFLRGWLGVRRRLRHPGPAAQAADPWAPWAAGQAPQTAGPNSAHPTPQEV